MLYVVLPPQWLKDENKNAIPLQRDCSYEEVISYNEIGYNIYYYPNYPSLPSSGFVKAYEVDTFEWVFVDMDLKDGVHATKDDFVGLLLADHSFFPTKIVDTGNGIHAYWRITDLDAMAFLRLSRRLCAYFNTDPAVTQLKQLMRVPDTANTKKRDEFKICETIYTSDPLQTYTCEQFDTYLPAITLEDEEFCKNHYAKVHQLQSAIKVDDTLPGKFCKLLTENEEVKSIWGGNTDDRSKGDWRLGHIMLAHGFTKAEAMSVLVNSAKAVSRSPTHRIGYADNIVSKIWTFEAIVDKDSLDLSSSVRDILEQHEGDSIKGTRFPCWKYIDNTEHGFRLGQVIGLVAGSGVGKTAVALNLFMGFVQNNPNYEHFFVPLEQPKREIAERWRSMCGDRTELHSKVHILSNYDEKGSFRDLSLETIKEYIVKFQRVTGKKVGCVVIDHIGVLANDNKLQDEGVKKISKAMKGFAEQTNTLLVMQSQTAREKAGIGDLELNKDAAFGTSTFENFCDYLVTIWQPLKRCYDNPACPTVTAFKFCKIRHKKQGIDKIREDVCYRLVFDPKTERLREFTQAEEATFSVFLSAATNKRKLDRKTDLVTYTSVKWDRSSEDGQSNNVHVSSDLSASEE